MTAAAQAGAAGFPVREGEGPWTKAEIAKVRWRLAEEAAELRTEIDRAESDIADRLGDSVSDAGDDQADVGAKAYEREHELSLAYNARELLMQTERALARIESGSYGWCESCGKPIGKARLQAFPRATLCVSCKQREERR
jgi:DnaK suppressor protein